MTGGDGGRSRGMEMLRWLLRRYGAMPFAEAEAAVLASEELSPLRTPAELRVAMLGLRRDGVLLAARNRWGDRTLYLPAEELAAWHSLLFAAVPEPLPFGERIVTAEGPARCPGPRGRAPLSRQLLRTWADLRRRGGLPLTANGALHRARAAKLAEAMELAPQELAPLLGAAAADDAAIQAALFLAIELGSELGVLGRTVGAIEAGSGDGWSGFDGTMEELDALLHSLLVRHYAPGDPGLHFAALSLGRLEPNRWYLERETREAFGMTERQPGRAGWDAWLRAAACFGWMEFGRRGEEETIRWTVRPHVGVPGKPGELSVPSGSSVPGVADVPERPVVYVQSDLEIIVPPEVGFGMRWRLEEIAERIALDHVSTYRLTRASCENAVRLGLRPERIAETLREAAGHALPAAATGAIEDWLRDVRTGEQAEAAGHTLRRSAWLAGPLLLLPRPEPLRDCEPDGSVPSRDELFPGLAAVPPAWLAQTRRYHASTRKDMAELALAWRTSLRIEPDGGGGYSFIPESLERLGESWSLVGRVRDAANGDVAAEAVAADSVMSARGTDRVALSVDSLGAIRLELPPEPRREL
ncbi:helicase-associated domain-containing protein [Cohnella fermenti]|uniref:Helicase XPB/Ssl2 N-terminal domain-containing protein n=1 Tax=Cohnella fermenti TaxID=2565925 RepID=A0A4S4BI18_9BACL|nr:helicase-associated domain-containing protein [Cohnella fermenti]THF74239.1 hypothetical protein E6C55_26080 [Cohnella fermenti]